jgi:hypothetical protein
MIAPLGMAGRIGPNDQGYLLLPFEIDGPAFRRCMEVRGYVLERTAAPRPARP